MKTPPRGSQLLKELGQLPHCPKFTLGSKKNARMMRQKQREGDRVPAASTVAFPGRPGAWTAVPTRSLLLPAFGVTSPGFPPKPTPSSAFCSAESGAVWTQNCRPPIPLPQSYLFHSEVPLYTRYNSPHWTSCHTLTHTYTRVHVCTRAHTPDLRQPRAGSTGNSQNNKPSYFPFSL